MPLRRRMALLALAACAACAGCSDSPARDWHGYYYRNVLSSAPGQVFGPFDSASSCIAAMQPMLRGAPTTANFTCARACHTASDGSVETCKQVDR